MGKRELSPLGICVLGLAAERPMHPYEMYQLMLERGEDRLVKVRPGTLYHTVSRLTAEKMLVETGTERDGNRPERTVYDITAHGRDVLQARLREQLATPAEEYPEFTLAIAEAHNLERRPKCPPCSTLRRAALQDSWTSTHEAITCATERGAPRQFWLDAEYTDTRCSQAEISWLDRT